MSRQYFGYYVNVDERGEFFADVRNNKQESVFEVRLPATENNSSLVEDGYMSHSKDIAGLSDYLRETGLIGQEDRVVESSEFERFLAKENPSREDCLADFEANIGAAMWNGESVFIGGGEFSSDELIEVHALLTAHNDEAESPFVGFSDDEKERVSTFLSNLKKAVFDRESVSIGGGDFNRDDLAVFESFLAAEIAKTAPTQSGPAA